MDEKFVVECLYKQTEIAVYKCLEEAEKYYSQSFPLAGIHFDMTGRSAGQVRFPLVSKKSPVNLPILRFNATLLRQNGDGFIKEVVPHECAHIVVYHLFRQSSRFNRQRPKPHGNEWRAVMRDVFKVEARVTHNFEVAASNSKVFLYRCACDKKLHHVSLIRHNKMKRGISRYLCKRCGDQLLAYSDPLVESGSFQAGLS